MSVSYAGGSSNATIQIDPWVPALADGEEIEWELDSPDEADRLQIVPKGGGWPFPGPPPHAQPRKQPIKAGPVSGAPGTVYQYYIKLLVREGNGPNSARRPLDIDPEFVISWDSKTSGKYT